MTDTDKKTFEEEFPDPAPGQEWFYKGYELYMLYMNGDSDDCVEAARCFTIAAEMGNKYAQNLLGECYMLGDGVEMDFEKAFSWFEKAAQQDYAPAQVSIGQFYENGWDVVPEDKEEAVCWFTKAAHQKHPGGMYCLGKCFMNGTGVPRSTAVGTLWLAGASALGHAAAHYDLGMYYCDPDNPERNLDLGIDYLKKAASGNEVTALQEDAVDALRKLSTVYNFRKAASVLEELDEL
ncbi:MAG: sel1 repeat family protein [Eubacteriaceae bacterium]|nr:sel1 repeat family protein [Eubacteriaceae bacterium]